ncbi:peptide chain release factor N(5)-glutamine methyltransferase [Aliiroseovarius sp. KMU-50]|uniref:Release factor glutamine methyltransferase n=1 Tax=Aliiroseovarius salicola TaxID=3009082 RepID=A0ABT4W268_9RHOB|nr:peptide chain release factor N(5)-glutamine methyltransferase [Aliiroseovarius sp. KMU-50]MDA5094597.1 peptide chain release factor N(5)-glutamine methyltransferase [Aliiroseovarius sp. KMU-50]
MITAQVLLVQATRRLNDAGVEGAAGDARALLAHVLGVERGRLTLILPDPVSHEQQTAFDRVIEARVNRQPVAQIIGKRHFYGRDFIVTGDVLDPRPETEELVAAALQAPFERVLDLGTGSGCILLTLLAEQGGATGVGVDLSGDALSVARQNAGALGVSDRVNLCQGSWFDPVVGEFDLVVSNPPYIAADEMPGLSQDVLNWEPHLALTPGGDGLDPYREIADKASKFMMPGGRLLVEIGPTQGAQVAAMFSAAGLRDVNVRRDIDGRDRVVCANMR